MRSFLRSSVLLSLLLQTVAAKEDWQSAKTIYEFSAKDIDGNEVSLEKYRGFVAVITNVASK